MKANNNQTIPTEQKKTLSLAGDLLRFFTQPRSIPDWPLKSKIIKSLISLIFVLRKRMNKMNETDSFRHVQTLNAAAAGLHSNFIICREMGYLSECDFLDLTDKLIRLTS